MWTSVALKDPGCGALILLLAGDWTILHGLLNPLAVLLASTLTSVREREVRRNAERLLVDGYGRVQPLNVATVNVRCSMILQKTVEFLEDRLENGNDSGFIRRLCGQPKLRAHRCAGSFDQPAAWEAGSPSPRPVEALGGKDAGSGCARTRRGAGGVGVRLFRGCSSRTFSLDARRIQSSHEGNGLRSVRAGYRHGIRRSIQAIRVKSL